MRTTRIEGTVDLQLDTLMADIKANVEIDALNGSLKITASLHTLTADQRSKLAKADISKVVVYD